MENTAFFREVFHFARDSVRVHYAQNVVLPPIQNGLYVVDTNTESLLRKMVGFNAELPLVCVSAGDEHKTMQSLERILQTALNAGLDRSACFVAVGGGMICDLSAFAASMYMRGVSCVLIPSSLLAMVDACIGGKSAVNFGGIKNSIGAFYQAQDIYIFVDLLQSLPEAQFRSGLAEVLKMAFLYDNGLLTVLRNHQVEILRRETSFLSEIIRLSIQSKAHVVATDVHDREGRRHLNFGHTFGHALESLSNFSILHGDAVAWGMTRALALSVHLGLCDRSYANEACEVLADYGFCTQNRPAQFKDQPNFPDDILKRMQKDKKNEAHQINCVLQKALYCTELQVVDAELIALVL